MLDKIIIKGAREHNLKNIDVEIPRNKLIVITGLSGSGKSTLAFDTIYAEGQRRYVESLSAYARQFLGLMNKPDVDSIEGLSPAISIEQKTTSKNPRSTVGTVTEIYDYLRLLFARIGIAHCPKCASEIKPQSAENITRELIASGGKSLILAPIIRGIKGTHEKIFDKLKQEGFTRVRVDGQVHRLDELDVKLKRYEKHWIEAVVDLVELNQKNKARITEAVEQALLRGGGVLISADPEHKGIKGKRKEISRSSGERVYTSHGACPKHPEISFEALEPRMFSFNSPFGACPNCLGLGEHQEIDPDLLIPDKSLSIMDGAIKAYGKMDLSWRAQQIEAVGKRYGFDVFTPIKDFTKKQLNILLYGTQDSKKVKWSTDGRGFEGIIPQTMRLYTETESDSRKAKFESLMVSKQCRSCNGRRLKDTILAVTVQGHSIIDVTDMNIKTALDFFKKLPKKLSEKDMLVAKQVLKEITDRLSFLDNVGLGYLTLSRSARTLSGGEAQRIRLATQIGSNLMGVLYILDEPSIGLHQRDNAKLISTLQRLRDIGNTLVVVEHDEDTIRAADHLIDMGPGAGVHGGDICARGTPEEVSKIKTSITGAYLSGRQRIDVPITRRKSKEEIVLEGASENNLKNITARFPLNVLCGITGVSGSGKSTLMNQTLFPALRKHVGEHASRIGKHKRLSVPKSVSSVIVIDQDPIGRTPRSNPATYTKLFDDIRALFASTKEARKRGYTQGRFSFNVKGGRCETCQGEGVIKIEMNFLPDVYVECEDCKGKRYNSETLSIHYAGKTIADVLEMTVEEALSFFQNHTRISRKLQTLFDVGLGYIKLGQSATTLSGGESQRIKLTRELSKQKRGHTIYLLDEPTTGLHFEDVRKLIIVLNRLVDKGNTVYVIEHNLDVIKNCDHIIDLGPEGGDLGGEIIATGTPEQICKNKKSHTGKFLSRLL
ncbi:excinuclease ABC subunit UvrA [Candidatus Woesearchaeota archaeon]|nr:MAG: excinuclease ABC subunit UvrA [Candidatus Woesearchaeota archaeon]